MGRSIMPNATTLASALFLIGAAAAPVATEVMPAFPTASDRPTVERWLVDTAGFPAGAPIDLGPDSAVVIVTDSTTGLKPGQHVVSFREEAVGVNFVARNGGRSITGSGGVDCNEGQFRMGGMTVFHGTGLKGERVASFPPQETWRTPPPGGVLQRVVESVCEAAPAAAGPASTASLAAALEAAPPAGVTSEGAGLRAAPQAETVTVQVGAFPARPQAAAGLAKAMSVGGAQVAGRRTEVAAATVNGAEMFRALIHGFSSRTEAQAFCARLRAQGQPCLVRP
jgi:hypothetical protein